MNTENRFFFAVPCAFVVLASGCANRVDMAFQNDAQKLSPTSKPVYLMTATIKNSLRSRFQPRLTGVIVEKIADKPPGETITFKIDDKARDETDSETTGNSYLLRMELESGRYEIQGMSSLARAFPITGWFFTPLHSPLKSGESGVFYLGHVAATVRERQGNEFKAGPSLPLIDQAVAGASGGTFDVTITDEFASDEALFRAKFPALNGVNIKKAILPSFDRAKAQRWWEAN